MLFCPAIKSDQTSHQASQRTSVRLTDQAQGSSRFASARTAAVPRRDEPVSRRGCARAASKGIFPRGAFARAAARDDNRQSGSQWAERQPDLLSLSEVCS